MKWYDYVIAGVAAVGAVAFLVKGVFMYDIFAELLGSTRALGTRIAYGAVGAAIGYEIVMSNLKD